MKYIVKKRGKHSDTHHRKNARAVLELVDEIYCYQGWRKGDNSFMHITGPNGIQYAIRTHDKENVGSLDVFIYEFADESVELHIPTTSDTDVRSSLVAPWVSSAFSFTKDETTKELLTQLSFGQLPLWAAAELLKVPSLWIESKMQCMDSGPSSVLRASINHSCFLPDSTTVDVSGLLAWLLLTSDSFKE